jgi:hypothetical protein
MLMKSNRVAAIAAGVVALAACSCGPTAPSTGTVRVLLTDAPIDMMGVKAVDVTVDGVWLFGAGTDSASATPLLVSGDSVSGGLNLNLLDYQAGKVALAATGDVPVGGYSRVRMHVTSATLVRDDDGDPATPDQVDPIFVPSGKVDVPVYFLVSGGATTEITLDFNAQLSVQVDSTPGQQGYILRPVITPVGARHS